MKPTRLFALAIASLSLSLAPRVHAATITEDFATDPATRGWTTFGDTNLFHWNSTNQNLEVTWDSTKSNSYFWLPLGMRFNSDDQFSLEFDLRLTDAASGITPGETYPFQLSVGLLNSVKAVQPGYDRGSGYSTPDLLEFCYFPDPGGDWIYGPSLITTYCDTNGSSYDHFSAGGFAPAGLANGPVYHVVLSFTGLNHTLNTTITEDGNPYSAVSAAKRGALCGDFRLDRLAIPSYSDAGQFAPYGGSILAHGTVDNLVVTLPPPVSNLRGAMSGGVWQTEFHSHSNWTYTLEVSTNFVDWIPVPPSAAGNDEAITLTDSNPPAGKAFYRVSATPQ